MLSSVSVLSNICEGSDHPSTELFYRKMNKNKMLLTYSLICRVGLFPRNIEISEKKNKGYQLFH